jgi:uncharacterized membrane protein YkvA (DUF1232 family)
MTDYYKFLQAELDNYEGDFDKFILYIPDFFKLLCKLTEENIDKADKKEIYSALAYFVIPNDVIPEDLYGPAGYIDDMFVCTKVLEHLKSKYGINFLNKYWDQDEDLEEVLNLCLEKSQKILDEKSLLNDTLKAASLD